MELLAEQALSEEQIKQTEHQLDVLKRSVDDFSYFTDHIFSLSRDVLKHGVFTSGEFVRDITSWMQANKQTIRVSAKDHFKSMSFYSHIMWKILRMYVTERPREIQYFSYKQMMASYHTAKLKLAIACNPYFADIIDLKEKAEGVISYTWDGRTRLTVTPRGLLEFNRGIHCDDVYVDDPLQDPENKMILTRIKKINDLMKLKILDMPRDELHIVGTAQTNNDFYFDKEFTSRFAVRVLPAILNEKTKQVLWQEWFGYEELQAKKKERGIKVFNQEFMCSPTYTEDAYFTQERIQSVVNSALKNYRVPEWKKEKHEDYDRVGGWDLGKKGHPAYFTAFEKRGDKRVQLFSKWFDGVDYTEQMAFIKECIDEMAIYKVYFDATRGEMEMAEEKGELPGEFEPITFTLKRKHSMATEFDKAVSNKKIELVNDQRMINQILVVNNELKAPETPEGHGDAFWGIGLSFCDAESEGVDITVL